MSVAKGAAIWRMDSLLVREPSRFVNVNKVDNCLRNRINSACMLFLSIYTFIIINNVV